MNTKFWPDNKIIILKFFKLTGFFFVRRSYVLKIIIIFKGGFRENSKRL